MDIHDIQPLLRNVRGRDNKFTAQCPAHADGRNSLSIGQSADGRRLLMHCHAGCTTESVVTALGLTVYDLFADKPQSGMSLEQARAVAERRERDRRLVEEFEHQYSEIMRFLAEFCRLTEQRSLFRSNWYHRADNLFFQLFEARTIAARVEALTVAKRSVAALLTQNSHAWREFFDFEF